MQICMLGKQFLIVSAPTTPEMTRKRRDKTMAILLRISLYRTCHPPTIHCVEQNGLETTSEEQGGAQRLRETQYQLTRVFCQILENK